MPVFFRSQSKFIQALLTILVIAAMVIPSLLPGGSAQAEALPDATPVVETPIPTQVPTETPPTQIPTEVPATSTPTPTEVAPTQVPTPVTPTPTPTAGRGISPQAIVSGTGCAQVSSTDIVPPGTAVEFRCEGAVLSLLGPVTRTIRGLTPGWQYQINNGTWRDSGGTESTSHPFGLSDYTIRIRPTTSVAQGSQGTLTIIVDTPSIWGGSYTTTIGATRQVTVPTAADLLLSCSPVSVSVGVNASQIVECTYSGRPTLGSRQITLTRINVPAPAGWTIASPTGSVTGRTLTITPNTPITYSATSPQDYTFTYTLTPACSAPTTAQSINLSSTFSFSTTSGITGATFSQQATRLDTSSLAVSITSNSLIWDKEYSLTDTTVSGNLMYRMTAAGCSGWSIQISASPYRYTGPNNGTFLPASNLQLSETGSPIVISGDGIGVFRHTASGPLDSPLKVMSATAGAGIGTYQQRLEFNLIIPGRSVAGTYQSTITVTSVAAP